MEMTRSHSTHILALAVVTVATLALATPANAEPLWTPADITTPLWLDAADAGTVTQSGGNISQWNDKSGNGRNATQVSGGNQPVYVAAGQNGLNVIRFNGTSQYLNLGTGLDWAAGTSHVAFGVLKNDNYTDLYGAKNASQGSASLHVGFRNNSSYRINYWGNDYYPPVTSNYDAGEYNFLRWVWPQGTPKSVYANAELEGTGGPNAGAISAMSGGGRIAQVVNHGYLDADLGELVFLEGTPTQDTIDRVEGYLAWKWGLEGKLPSDHPYFEAAPLGVPEPATIALVGLAACGLGGYVRKRRKA